MTLPDRSAPGDIPVAEFTRYAHQLVEWIGAYLDGPSGTRCSRRCCRATWRVRCRAEPPQQPESLADILADFESKILPGVTHWNHPGFFAYFAISSSAPGILAEMLIAALNVNGMLWKTSPSATELEQVALDWLRQLLGLGPGWFGIINDTASISTLLALAAAREAKPELDIRERGMAGRAELPVLRVYASEHAHSSVDKAAITLGIGHQNVVKIGVDAEYRMRPELLEAAIDADRARGYLPIAVVATVGTTSTTSVDPVALIAEVCRSADVWLHVDGAYGGVAAVVPGAAGRARRRSPGGLAGGEPHKWLFTPIDLSAFYTRRPTCSSARSRSCPSTS
jgi:aromatic-L-amino-acid decarboxylase